MGMSWRRFSTAGIVLAVTCGLAPATAQAVVRRVWWQGDHELEKGAAPLPVAIQGGTITVRLLSGPHAGEQISCKKDKGRSEVWNPAPDGFGEDTMKSLTFSKCTNTAKASCTVSAVGLPWHSTLFRESAEESGDTFEGVSLEVGCGAAHSLLEGKLAGAVPTNHIDLEGPLVSGSGEEEADISMPLRLKAKGGPISINA